MLLAWSIYWYFNYKVKTIEYKMQHVELLVKKSAIVKPIIHFLLTLKQQTNA
jgi:hypothetical protein